MSEPKGCLFFLAEIFKSKPEKEKKVVYPYNRKKLLSNAELSFYHCLLQILPEEYTVMCKCRMEDIMYVPKGTENHMKYRGYIKSRHIDFVICEKNNMYTRLAIELDDKSHKNTKEIDKRKDEILKAVKIPTIRIKAQKTYNLEELKNSIFE